MRCPKCGYVSFDHLDDCKQCGADLQEVKRARGAPALGVAAVSPIPSPTSLSAGPMVSASLQEPEARAQEADALLVDLSEAPAPAPTFGHEPQQGPAFRLPLEELQPLRPSSGIPPPSSSAPSDDSDAVSVSAPARAGFWIRLTAWIADIVCLFLATIVLAFLVVTTIWFGGRLGGEINDQVRALAGISGAVIVTISGFLYFTLFVGSCGQTPGKMLLGLKIVREDELEMTYGRACLRSWCWVLSLLLFSLGFLMIAVTRQKRGLHDFLAGTSVIRVRRGS